MMPSPPRSFLPKGAWLPWVGILLLASTPLLALVGFGAWFLWEQQWHWYALSAAVVPVTLAWGGAAWLRKRTRLRAVSVEADSSWSLKGKEAWRQVELTARAARKHPEWLTDPDALRKVAWRVVRKVSHAFHGASEQAMLELSAPELLRTLELALAELRLDLSRHVPGSHLLTLGDLMRAREWATVGDRLYDLYRLLSLGLTPQAALLREVRDYFTRKVGHATRDELQGWLLETLIRRFGFHAIELYSGRVALEADALEQHVTLPSKAQMEQARQRQERLETEPLRLLIIGQTGSGKTSLVNALFGELRAVEGSGSLRKSSRLTPHLFEREGQERALLLDSQGYGHPETHEAVMEALEEAVVECDLLLMTCAAHEAGRALDAQALKRLQQRLREHDQDLLPVLAVVTHVDRLRPLREWDPPYDIAEPERPKAQNIRAALDAVADALTLDVSQTVPACLRTGQVYNVEDGVLPAIWEQLDDALRRKYARCLEDYREKRDWSLAWEQALAAGRFLTRRSLKSLGRTLKRAEETTSNWLP